MAPEPSRGGKKRADSLYTQWKRGTPTSAVPYPSSHPHFSTICQSPSGTQPPILSLFLSRSRCRGRLFFFYRILICIVSHRRYRRLQAAFGPSACGEMWVVSVENGGRCGRSVTAYREREKARHGFGRPNEWKLRTSLMTAIHEPIAS